MGRNKRLHLERFVDGSLDRLAVVLTGNCYRGWPMSSFHGRTTPAPGAVSLRRFFGVFQYSGRAISLVWTTSRALTIALIILSLLAGLLPAAIAYVGKLIVDAIVLAAANDHDPEGAIRYLVIEGGIVVGLAAAQRGITMMRALLARPARSSRQRAGSRKGAHPGSAPLRGLRVLRQDDPGPARGVEVVRSVWSCARSGWCKRPSRWSPTVRSWSRSPAGSSWSWGSRRCPRSSPRLATPARRFACSGGARPRRGSRCTSRRSSPARTTPKRSRSLASAGASSSATTRSSRGSTLRIAA